MVFTVRKHYFPPVPAKPWKGVLDASKIHVVCPQRNIYTRSEVIEGDEDCLYLNIYTPQLSATDKSLYPVMIFLHGGGWLCGSGNTFWYGPDILLDKDVVLVVPNYRLGALGFLTTGDEVVPGNNGLKDQNLAMKWVKANIDKFGGDPEKITIFGESAGGASAHLHILSPLSRDLFHGAISQSGTANTCWAVSREGGTLENSNKLAKSVGCPTTNSNKMIECLRKIDANEIISKDKIFMEWDTDPMIPFKPVVEPKHEGAFITEYPSDIIKSGNVANVPWITGINTEDGVLRAASIYGNPNLVEDLNQEFEKVVSISLLDKNIYMCPNSQFVSNKLREFYFNNNEITNETRYAVIDMYTDGWFLAAADESVGLHKKYTNTPVYYYLFGHYGMASFSQIFGDASQRYGVCHADELQYLFPVGDALFPEQVPDELDNRTADILTTLWTNFAKFGEPTPELNYKIHVKWEPVQSDDFEYYYIGGGVHAAKGLLSERAKFWRSLPLSFRKGCVKDEL